MVTKENMLLFLEQNVDAFSARFQQKLEQAPPPSIEFVSQVTLAPNGNVYINEDTTPELFKQIGLATLDTSIKAVLAFIESYSEQVDAPSNVNPPESIADLRIRVDLLEKRMNDTLPPIWVNKPPDDSMFN